MLQTNTSNSQPPAFFEETHISLDAFDTICSQTTHLADYPLASSVEQKILIYESRTVRHMLETPEQETQIKAELCRALKDGPGIIVMKNAYLDLSILDRTTDVFQEIVAEERSSGQGKGDHFGNNERIWNSIQKACLRNPDLFIDYFSNPIFAIACEAWLGPFYQITAQMNNIKPGSPAQLIHRDYHLGFQSQDKVAQFPVHAQIMSQYLTLQGAIAHCGMPLELGPTMLVPYSHQYEAGYLAYTRLDFQEYCTQNKAQIPLNIGDMVFFSPAIFHGAGANTSQMDRTANLVQISSAFGTPIETVNRTRMIEAVYPLLLKRVIANALTSREIHNTIAAVVEGYPFPTNLDLDVPDEGMVPESNQELLYRALKEKWSLEQLQTAMALAANRRKS